MKQSRLLLENGAEVFGCGGFGLWGCSPHAPGNIGCCIPHGALLSRKASRVCKGCSWIWGPAPPPCPRVNAGRLIPNDALSGIKKVQKTLKNSVECLGSWRRGFWMWGLWFVGLLAPRPRQHGMLHPTWCSFEQKGFAGLQGVQLDMGACAAPMPPA